MPHSHLVDRVNIHSGLSKYAHLEDVLPRLGCPTRCATWSDLEFILAGGSIDGLTEQWGEELLGRFVVTVPSEDCRSMGHDGGPR